MRLPRNIKAAIVHGQRSHSVAAMHPLSIGRIQLRGLVAEASNRYAVPGSARATGWAASPQRHGWLRRLTSGAGPH